MVGYMIYARRHIYTCPSNVVKCMTKFSSSFQVEIMPPKPKARFRFVVFGRRRDNGKWERIIARTDCTMTDGTTRVCITEHYDNEDDCRDMCNVFVDLITSKFLETSIEKVIMFDPKY